MSYAKLIPIIIEVAKSYDDYVKDRAQNKVDTNHLSALNQIYGNINELVLMGRADLTGHISGIINNLLSIDDPHSERGRNVELRDKAVDRWEIAMAHLAGTGLSSLERYSYLVLMSVLAPLIERALLITKIEQGRGKYHKDIKELIGHYITGFLMPYDESIPWNEWQDKHFERFTSTMGIHNWLKEAHEPEWTWLSWEEKDGSPYEKYVVAWAAQQTIDETTGNLKYPFIKGYVDFYVGYPSNHMESGKPVSELGIGSVGVPEKSETMAFKKIQQTDQLILHIRVTADQRNHPNWKVRFMKDLNLAFQWVFAGMTESNLYWRTLYPAWDAIRRR